jgi:hypothetical protein
MILAPCSLSPWPFPKGTSARIVLELSEWSQALAAIQFHPIDHTDYISLSLLQYFFDIKELTNLW